MKNELNGVNEAGLENGFGVVTPDAQAKLEDQINAMRTKIANGGGVSMNNQVANNVGDIAIKGGSASDAPIIVGVGNYTSEVPNMPTLDSMPGIRSAVTRMDRTLVASGIEAGVFGQRSAKDIATEELRNARWYQKHVDAAWIPGSTEKAPKSANLSMVTDGQNNDELFMYNVIVNGEVIPCISLMPATFNKHLEDGYRVVLRVMHTMKGARYYPLSYKLDEDNSLHSVAVHGLTHPVKKDDGTNVLDTQGKATFEFNDGITIQVSAQLHSAGHVLVARFIEWAKANNLEY